MASNIAITEKKKNKSHKSYMPETFWNKITDFKEEPVVQCDVLAVKNTSLDDGNNDDHKHILISTLNVLFLKLTLCIISVS